MGSAKDVGSESAAQAKCSEPVSGGAGGARRIAAGQVGVQRELRRREVGGEAEGGERAD